MPKDVPPRPGEPGYEEFIAHGGQPPQINTTPAATPVAAPVPASTAAAPAGTAANVNMQTMPPAGARTNSTAAVQGGLY